MTWWKVLLVVVLAGCAAPMQQPTLDEPGSPAVITDPDDYSYNTTRAHLHDYWANRSEIVVLDKYTGLGGMQAAPYVDWPVVGDTDELIPQGARWINITTTWNLGPPDRHGRLELWLRTGAESEPFLLDEMVNGETLTFLSTNAHNDLPHQRLSAWEFIIRLYADETGIIALQGGAEVNVTAARGLDIPLYPGHPDQWHGKDELDLLDASVGLGASGGPFDPDPGIHIGAVCINACLGEHRPDDGAIVPYDARAVLVTMTDTSGTGAVFQPGLRFSDAQSREWQDVSTSSNGSPWAFEIPVNGGGDGAYAGQSLWRLQTTIRGPVADGVWAGSYDISAVAVR